MAVGDRLTDDSRDWDTGADGTVRMAVVGLGGYAVNRALPALSAADYCEPTVAVSGSPDTAADVRAEYDLDRVLDYDGYHDGEATDAYDAVYVATPPALHLAAVETAARLDKHVCCEKPMAATVEGAERMRAACRDAGVTLAVAYRMQFDPVVRRVRELCREGTLGEVVQFHGSISIRLRTAWGGALDTWRTDRDLAGGGALPDLGVYPLNTARFLHDAPADAVQGSTTTTDPAFGSVDQHVAYTLGFADGATGSFSASFDAVPESHFQVLGTEGRVFVDGAFVPRGQRRVRADLDGERVDREGSGVDEIEETFAAFGHAVLTGRETVATADDGLADMRAMAAVYESDETGARVGL
ncbi:D-xylose 1-dehydrogenase Gfo6 [Halorarius halobius]|uniref:D-xylose 1-dehydrogenase Gfo6 n=1 Tax=Halorarius halobius TaxID=2962671 RepID=UPI0020CC88C4|nr:D-xylose 1-dehydrogenase Gfo6 [Halorarius halobius]